MNDKKTPDHAPSRYEFSDESRPDETGTIRELIDEINRENWPVRGNRKAKKLDELKKKKETIIIDNGSFKSIRKGIKEIINIKVATAEKRQVPITELKTIYTLYRYSDDKGIELFGRLGLPHLKRPSL